MVVVSISIIFVFSFFVYCIFRFLSVFGLVGIILILVIFSEFFVWFVFVTGVGRRGFEVVVWGFYRRAFVSFFSGRVDYYS